MAIYIPGGFYPPDITNPGGVNAPSIVVKTGPGSGDYATMNQSYVDVDLTNLSYTTSIATGTKLLIQISASGSGPSSPAGRAWLALLDGASILTQAGTGYSAAPGMFSLAAVVTGDNASHTFKLQMKSDSGGNATIYNSTSVPVMIFTLLTTSPS